MTGAAITIVIGIWLMVAPGTLGLSEPVSTSLYITGPLVVTIGVMALSEVNRVVRFGNTLAGVWLLASVIILDQPSEAIWNNLICGALLIGCSLMKGKITHTFNGGWASLFRAQENFFRDKVVVITGATGGVGRVTAWAFARQGAKVALIARDEEQLRNTKKEVEVYGGTALTVKVDVADADDVEAAAEKIERELGPIDIWINNAMNSVFAPVSQVTPEEYKRVTEVTYLGSVYGTMSALKRMRARNKGSIVLVGSALAYRGIPLQSAYCGAKHGVEGFYDSLRTELMHEKSNIRMSMVQLPAMNTTQFGWVLNKLGRKGRPMGKIYQPEVAARAILFAAQHNRRELFVGYTSFQAIWGNKFAPWYADWVLSRNAFDGQQTDEPTSPKDKNNLWKPVGEDRGAYGNFKDQAAGFSITLWMSMNRIWVAIGSAMVIGLLLLAILMKYG